jgi:type I restriction-modification system DNA methylase subunit
MARSATDIKTLVLGFAQHIKELKAPDYKESQARQHYIDPFWELLGWDVRNREQRAPKDVDVVVEPSLDAVDDRGLRSREPDYLFRLNEFPRFIVEAKKPSVDLDTDKTAIYQAKRYAWNLAIPFAILTDFEQFRLYDTTLKPILNDPNRGLVAEFRLDFQQYPAQWDVLLATFGREAVAGGSLERLRARIRKVPSGRRLRTVDRMLIDLKGDEPVDKVFLAYLEKYRQHFAREIYRENKNHFPDADTLHGAAKLTEAVQRLIDRLVFMRVCEDRGISTWGGLRELVDRIAREGGDLYKTLCRGFRELDVSYNGYIFKFHFSEELEVPDHVLSDFIRNLYPSEGPWDFARIGDDILGIVYERFLGHVVTVRRGQVDVVEKPEVRHAGGVYYTPRFVVETIIRRVVGPKITGKTPREVLDVKILDPACGSGSFLVAAFQYLIDHCLAAIGDDPSLAQVPATPKARKKRKDIAFKDPRGTWRLAPDFKADLLTHCIHGVDIDQQAVEVTVMSLYLKMLEGELPPNWQREWLENELLPPLDNNIQCGNSLIGSTDFDRYCVEKLGGLFPVDEDIRFRMNRFDWASRTRGFGRILDAQAAAERGRAGFDCIIGNPPYIRVQELKKWAPEECEFYKWNYKAAAKGNYDIYVVFTERALNLLAPDGLLGFIMPHKFWQAQYGEGLRKLIADGKHLKAVVDFKQEQVFRGATTYTAIHVISKSASEGGVDYAATTKLIDGIMQMGAIEAGIPFEGTERCRATHPDAGNWSFVAEADRMATLLADSGAQPLSSVARLAQGIKTSADGVFVVNLVAETKHHARILSEQTGKEHDLEWTAIRPLIKSEHMRRFRIEESKKYLLFPYRRKGEKYEVVPAATWRAEMPLTWAYLSEVKDVLQARERGKMKDRADWFAYIYPKNFEVLSRPKLCIPDMSEHMQVCIDAKGEYIFSGGAAGGNAIVPNDPSHLLLLAGVLNSRLIETSLRQTGTKFRGGYLNCEIRFIRDLPIKLPTTAEDKKLAERITQCVRAIIDAKVKLREARLSDRQRDALERDIEAHERRINEAVYRLYRVDGLPSP